MPPIVRSCGEGRVYHARPWLDTAMFPVAGDDVIQQRRFRIAQPVGDVDCHEGIAYTLRDRSSNCGMTIPGFCCCRKWLDAERRSNLLEDAPQNA